MSDVCDTGFWSFTTFIVYHYQCTSVNVDCTSCLGPSLIVRFLLFTSWIFFQKLHYHNYGTLTWVPIHSFRYLWNTDLLILMWHVSRLIVFWKQILYIIVVLGCSLFCCAHKAVFAFSNSIILLKMIFFPVFLHVSWFLQVVELLWWNSIHSIIILKPFNITWQLHEYWST